MLFFRIAPDFQYENALMHWEKQKRQAEVSDGLLSAIVPGGREWMT